MIKCRILLFSLIILSSIIGQSIGQPMHTMKDQQYQSTKTVAIGPSIGHLGQALPNIFNHDLRSSQQGGNNHSSSSKKITRRLLSPRQYTDTDSNDTTAVVIVGCIAGVAILTGVLTLLIFQWRKKKSQARNLQFSNTPHTVDNGDIDGFIAERKHLFSKFNHHHDHYHNNGKRFPTEAQIIQPPHTPENDHERRISVASMYGVEKPDGHFHQGSSRNYNFTIDSSSDDEDKEIPEVALQRVKPDGSAN